MLRITLGILGVAAVATAGDALWYELGVEHRILAGIVHGALLLAAAGAVVGLASDRPAAGTTAGAAAGVGGAVVYYALAGWAGGRVAMGAAWGSVWLLLAIFSGRLLRSRPSPWSVILARGSQAAVLSGLAFLLVLRALWGPPPEGGRSYLVQYGAWLFAWAPGLLTLTWARRIDENGR